MTRRRDADPAATYPAFARLIGAYLHEDRDLEDASDEEAVRRFAREAAPAAVQAARGDITRLLAAARTERALDSVLQRLGAASRPKSGLKRWLRDLQACLGR